MGVHKQLSKQITDNLNFTQFNSIGIYLGCPNLDKRRTRSNFSCFKYKIAQKLIGWKARILSNPGKLF